MHADLVFANDGNRYEVIMGASFVVLVAPGGPSFWDNRFARVTLMPMTLAPRESVCRRITQPIDDEALLVFTRTNPTHPFDDDPIHEAVALEILVRDRTGLPRRHVILVAKYVVGGAAVDSWELFENVRVDSSGYGGVLQRDLLKGGTVGQPGFLDFTHRDFSSGLPVDDSSQ